jgi:MFS family permease
MDFYRHLFTKSGKGGISFTLVYFISTLFTFQSLLPAYSSSTYMERFTAAEMVGMIYAVAAFFAIILTFSLPSILRAIGNTATTLLFMLSMMISLIIVGLAPSASLVIIGFIAFNALYPQIYLTIDIYIESLIGDSEHDTGSKRGFLLTLMSLAAFLAPLTLSYLVGETENIERVYFASAIIGFAFIAFILAFFRRFTDPVYETVKIRNLLSKTVITKDISTVMIAQFLLQFFFTWSVIYFPLYFSTIANLNWDDIGLIIAAGLFAFVIFEYPIGLIADRHWGEKEMMAVGFVILALCSSSLIYLTGATVTTFMIVMFLSRVGASLVEVTTESYFFKQVSGKDSNVISLFRLMRPLGNLLGALGGTLALVFFPLSFIFVLLGLLMVVGVFITLRLTDTR